MGVSEWVFGSLLVLALLALSGYFGWRQVLILRKLRRDPPLPADEARYEKRKAVGRLVSSALILVMALLFVTVLVLYEGPVQEMAEERAAFTADNAPPFTDQQKMLLWLWVGTWIALLLVLLAVMVLVGLDVMATRRYALTQFRKLQADRRAMIERQASRLRQQRNGQG